MCLFRSAPQVAQSTPAPIIAKKQDKIEQSELPTKKDLTDPEEVAGVEYGTTAKKGDAVNTAKATGTDALKINVNTGATGGSGTGGLNV
tara:strand:+ start:21 stop:287 length:267 start_codon:yes stop_codon:yes gene_type:complete